MKKYLLILFFFCCIVFSGCGNNNGGNKTEGETGENLSGNEILNDMLSDVNDGQEIQENNVVEENIDGEIKSEQERDNLDGEQSAGEVVEQAVSKQSWFGVEECNRIIDFDLCIINKAPIENQPVMKESLQSAIESRKIMANAQLREVCQDIVMSNSFKEVVAHYEGLEDGCIY